MRTRGERVQVLLSTFNGERYLRAFLDSVLAQTHAPSEILVRDDGSTDGTVALLYQYAANAPLRVWEAANVGVPASYFELLKRAGGDADYVALADQDDVWLPDKLGRAVSALGAAMPADRPALYCARAFVTDAMLRTRGKTPDRSAGLTLANALVENAVTGCTAVMDRHGIELVQSAASPRHAIMHDAWLYLVFAAMGVLRYDPAPVVLYRQHSANAMGLASSGLGSWIGRATRELRARHRFTRQAAELLELYGDRLGAEASATVAGFAAPDSSVAQRVRFVRGGGIRRSDPLSDVLIKALYVVGQA